MKISSINYYFSKKDLLISKEIKKKELIKHHAHPKRRLSVTDDADNDSDDNDLNEILADNDSKDTENSIEKDNTFCQFTNL